MENYKTDNIVLIEIDNSGRLNIKPESVRFTLIYRTATEVHWNNVSKTLYSPQPKDWTYLDWFNHIIKVAREECFCSLIITDQTVWINIPNDLKAEIIKME
jgi:hypothetical protein